MVPRNEDWGNRGWQRYWKADELNEAEERLEEKKEKASDAPVRRQPSGSRACLTGTSPR
jgi:hypothetical protein